MCGGNLLNILIEKEQAPFWTEDSLTNCTRSWFFLSYIFVLIESLVW